MENVNLSDYSNYKIGGSARYFFQPKNVADITHAVRLAKEKDLPVFVLGKGTNLLIDDKKFDGVIINPLLDKIEREDLSLKVEAGVDMEDLLNYVIDNELSGLEWAGGLPGTFGGAVRGNAGAFGGEIKDLVQDVESLDISSDKPKLVKRSYDECNFGYRTSVFKENDGQEIILSAVLKMKPGDKEVIKKAIDEKIKYRKERQPLEYPNVGSIFKNVDARNLPKEQLEEFKDVIKTDPFPVVPTAHLISEVGLKGKTYGGAMVSEKHPNFIVNKDHASAEDVKKLIELIKRSVKDKFNIILEEEVIHLK